MRPISRRALSGIGAILQPGVSEEAEHLRQPHPTPPRPAASAFALSYSRCLRSCSLMGAVVMAPLPPVWPAAVPTSRAPSLHGHYPASSLLRARPPSSRRRPTSRGRRLYGLPCSADFAAGRGGLLQLLYASSSPCCRSHPAGVPRRLSHAATGHAAFALCRRARPPDLGPFGATTAFACVTAR